MFVTASPRRSTLLRVSAQCTGDPVSKIKRTGLSLMVASIEIGSSSARTKRAMQHHNRMSGNTFTPCFSSYYTRNSRSPQLFLQLHRERCGHPPPRKTSERQDVQG